MNSIYIYIFIYIYIYIYTQIYLLSCLVTWSPGRGCLAAWRTSRCHAGICRQILQARKCIYGRAPPMYVLGMLERKGSLHSHLNSFSVDALSAGNRWWVSFGNLMPWLRTSTSMATFAMPCRHFLHAHYFSRHANLFIDLRCRCMCTHGRDNSSLCKAIRTIAPFTSFLQKNNRTN